MKKKSISILTAACMMVMLLFSPSASLISNAETGTTISGTVVSGTTDDTLYLSTTSGKMEIKLDSNTDTSSCKLLLPNDNIDVTVYRGSDAYMHASKISNGENETAATVDTVHTATVNGTIASGTTSRLIYFSTSAGTMQIKLDSTTDTSGCGVLTIGKEVSITFGRGSDAYMHAIKIDKKAGTATTVVVNGQTMPNVYGTVGSNTSSTYLYLRTSSGTMEIKVDSNTDISGCKALISSQPIYVACYRDTDAYMHAAKITSALDNSFNSATVNSSSPVTVIGTVASGTTPYILFLSTNSGTMQIRLDDNTNMNGRPLTLGKSVQVSLGYGSDYYHHAISISER